MADREAWLRLRDEDGYMAPARLRVLLALIRVHQRDGRATVRSVAAEAGLRSESTAHQHLRLLRADRLVGWAHEASATLRPLVAAVPFAAHPSRESNDG